MGSRDKKGNLKYYQVRVTDYKIDDCECVRQFRPYSPCKHMKRLKEKLDHLNMIYDPNNPLSDDELDK